MTHEQTARSRRMAVVALVLVAITLGALVVGGFLRGLGHNIEDGGCDCPVATALIASLDWAGTGWPLAVEVQGPNYADPDQRKLHASYVGVLDPWQAFGSLESRLRVAGYEPAISEDPQRGYLPDIEGEWVLDFWIGSAIFDHPPAFNVTVTLTVSDEGAPAALEGVAAAVGQR